MTNSPSLHDSYAEDKKVDATYAEYTVKDVSSGNSIRELEGQEVDDGRLVRKIDFHLVPWLALLYLLSFLDRSNIGNANLFGLSVDINLDSTDYATCLSIFFVFYVLCEVPSNMVMKAWRPSMWLPIIMIAWGGVMTGMGFVKNFEGLLIARVFLGATEAGLFPGVAYFLSQWYRRHEIAFRVALFFSAATAAGAFGGLLARLINLMHGAAGYEGWRWIFILEGIATIIVATASFWTMYDYPDTAKFLTDAERRHTIERLHLDNDGCSNEFKMKFVWDAFLDWKVWVNAIMFHGALCPLYTFSLFSPTLVKNLGYTAAQAQLMSVPPYVVAAFCTVVAGWLSDRLKMRGIITIVFGGISAIGYILLLAHVNNDVDYFALFLASSGIYPLIPVITAWGSNNAGGSLKKGVSTAIIVSLGNCGGIVSSFIYPKEHGPRYIVGHAVCLGYCVLTMATAALMWWYGAWANAKKVARNEARGRPWTAEEKKALEDDGDNVDWFFYTI